MLSCTHLCADLFLWTPPRDILLVLISIPTATWGAGGGGVSSTGDILGLCFTFRSFFVHLGGLFRAVGWCVREAWFKFLYMLGFAISTGNC